MAIFNCTALCYLSHSIAAKDQSLFLCPIVSGKYILFSSLVLGFYSLHATFQQSVGAGQSYFPSPITLLEIFTTLILLAPISRLRRAYILQSSPSSLLCLLPFNNLPGSPPASFHPQTSYPPLASLAFSKEPGTFE